MMTPRIGWKPLEHAGRAGNLGGCRHEVNSCASGLHFKSRHELNATTYSRVSTDTRATDAGGPIGKTSPIEFG